MVRVKLMATVFKGKIRTYLDLLSIWQRFCFGMVSTTNISLSMRGRYNNEIAE